MARRGEKFQCVLVIRDFQIVLNFAEFQRFENRGFIRDISFPVEKSLQSADEAGARYRVRTEILHFVSLRKNRISTA